MLKDPCGTLFYYSILFNFYTYNSDKPLNGKKSTFIVSNFCAYAVFILGERTQFRIGDIANERLKDFSAGIYQGNPKRAWKHVQPYFTFSRSKCKIHFY
jgi:hypothetical protein